MIQIIRNYINGPAENKHTNKQFQLLSFNLYSFEDYIT